MTRPAPVPRDLSKLSGATFSGSPAARYFADQLAKSQDVKQANLICGVVSRNIGYFAHLEKSDLPTKTIAHCAALLIADADTTINNLIKAGRVEKLIGDLAKNLIRARYKSISYRSQQASRAFNGYQSAATGIEPEQDGSIYAHDGTFVGYKRADGKVIHRVAEVKLSQIPEVVSNELLHAKSKRKRARQANKP